MILFFLIACSKKNAIGLFFENHGLPGVTHDQRNVTEIAEKLGQNYSALSFGNNDFSANESDKSKKQKIINKMKRKVKKRSHNVLYYSGHGFVCEHPSDGRKLFAIPINNRLKGGKCDDSMITEEELVELGFSSFVLDACHSGKITLEHKRKIKNRRGSFVIASSQSDQVSIDNKERGWLLMNTIKNLLNKKYLCLLDFDKDGSISMEELELMLHLGFTYRSILNKEEFSNVQSMVTQFQRTNPQKIENGFIRRIHGRSSTLIEFDPDKPRDTQKFESALQRVKTEGDGCFLNVRRKCKGSRNYRSSCLHQQNKFAKFYENLNNFLSNTKNFDFVFDKDQSETIRADKNRKIQFDKYTVASTCKDPIFFSDAKFKENMIECICKLQNCSDDGPPCQNPGYRSCEKRLDFV